MDYCQKIRHSASFILLICSLLFVGVTSGASEGGQTGGGGTIVLNVNGYTLLDFLRWNSDFIEPQEIRLMDGTSNPSVLLRKEALVLQESPVQLQNLDSYQLALKIIAAWSDEKFITGFFTPSISDAFSKQVNWELVEVPDQSIQTADTSGLSNLQDSQLAAHFKMRLTSPLQPGIAIVVPEFNKIGILSQAGLFVHEGLRNIQLGRYAQAINSSFDDLALQKATAIIVFCRPSAVLNQYINFLLLNNSVFADSMHLDLNKSCKPALNADSYLLRSAYQ